MCYSKNITHEEHAIQLEEGLFIQELMFDTLYENCALDLMCTSIAVSFLRYQLIPEEFCQTSVLP